MDASIVQTIIIIGVILSFFSIMQFQLRGLETRLNERIKDLRDDVRRNHQELKDLLLNHTHDNDGVAVLRLPSTARD